MTDAPPFVVLTPEQMQDYRTRLVNAKGDLAKAGLTVQDMRNAIYTKATHASPNVEIAATSDPGEVTVTIKGTKAKGTKAKTLDAGQMDDLIG